MAPITVTSSPCETCAVEPTDSTLRTIASTSSGDAPSFITIIIWSLLSETRGGTLLAVRRWVRRPAGVLCGNERRYAATGRLAKSPIGTPEPALRGGVRLWRAGEVHRGVL